MLNNSLSAFQWSEHVPQLSFDSTETLPPYILSTRSQPAASVTGQLISQPEDPYAQAEQRSILPVPYQSAMQLQQVRQPTITLHLIPEKFIEHLLPDLSVEANKIHIPPMYTKKRSLTPKYRAIGGLLSILIMGLLLCTGAGYYARASGNLDAFRIFAGSITLKKVYFAPKTNLPDPPEQTEKDRGPAYDIISSAATTTRINPDNNFALQEERIFRPGQTFYATFGTQTTTTDGNVYMKWYTNKQPYRTMLVARIKSGSRPTSASVTMQYPQPAEGMVEFYWNDQFAQRLYFVVR